MKHNKIFVYGTLMKDFKNFDRYLKGKVRSICPAQIKGALYHLNVHNCPAIISGNDVVYGEVIEFEDDETDSTLRAIDHFEKFFFENASVIYERTATQVFYSNGTQEMLSFYKLTNLNLLETEKAIYIPFGDWRKYMQIH